MITLREAFVEDLILLAENAMEPGINIGPDEIRRVAKFNMDSGPAYTAEFEGRIVAAAGVRLIRAGIGEIWIVISKDIGRNYGFLKEALTAMRNMTEILAKTFILREIRTTSRPGFPQSQSLLKHLGFRRLRRLWRSQYIFVRRF